MHSKIDYTVRFQPEPVGARALTALTHCLDVSVKEYGRADADSTPATVSRYGVLSTPTLLVFRDGDPRATA
ncbi:thioredoxin family protein [Streptomyces subrutilus]|uniref:thioredoxin family protein n=1 Tax=Streptomyces subrutilus TaxID=36818 RepID=UPI0033FDFDF1